MEEKQIGLFIRDRRLALGLTQQQLADRLGITDKAVSKWERAVSYPDITILRELAAALNVSVTELLAGERDRQLPDSVPPEVQEVVMDTVAYAETARVRNGGWRWWTFVALTIGCLIAAVVLGILAICIYHIRLFCLLALQCVAIGWAICYALLRTEDRPIRNAMAVASIAVYPFIWFWGARSAWHLGIVIVSLAYAWTVYWICRNFRRDMGMATSLIVILGILLHVSINILLVNRWNAGWVLAVVALTLTAGAICLGGVRVLGMILARLKE